MKVLLQDVVEGRTRPLLKPEERLLLAVVESAYWDLQSSDPARRRTAQTYFLDETNGHTFSFNSICEHFSWSPASIRDRLATLLSSLAAGGVHWGALTEGKAPIGAAGR